MELDDIIENAYFDFDKLRGGVEERLSFKIVLKGLLSLGANPCPPFFIINSWEICVY